MATTPAATFVSKRIETFHAYPSILVLEDLPDLGLGPITTLQNECLRTGTPSAEDFLTLTRSVLFDALFFDLTAEALQEQLHLLESVRKIPRYGQIPTGALVDPETPGIIQQLKDLGFDACFSHLPSGDATKTFART
jgi:hypothetical protein